MNRKNIKLNEHVLEKLQKYKDSIHDFTSKCRVPLSWGEFFMIIVSDWENSRSKCHCGKFFDCDHCAMLDEISRRR
jgi:hypothetical protein